MSTRPYLSQVQKLDRLLSDHEGEWVPLPEVLALGIAAYSRRFEDLRKIYGPQGYSIENRCERGHDGIVRSWYRKFRAGYPLPEKPESNFSKPEPRKENPRKSAKKLENFSLASFAVKTWAEVCAERDRKISESKTVPDLVLTP